MTIGFFPGSFDPFTIGHLNVLKKSCQIFDTVILGISVNSLKKRRYDKSLMKKAIIQTLEEENLTNVKVIEYLGMTVNKAKFYNSDYIVRGIRNGMDYNYEENIALINEEVGKIDTLYFRAGSLGIISSSMVYELIKNNEDVSKYLPPPIYDMIFKTKT